MNQQQERVRNAETQGAGIQHANAYRGQVRESLRQFEGYTRHYSIHIGGVYSSREPAVVRTILGSCIAVCLRDPATKVGGMNHFMLPAGGMGEGANARYGIHAMELLINECMKMGADRRRLEAKVFGGGHVLRVQTSASNVPQSNIRFALQFLATEGIPILARDLGGFAAREVYFFTDSGRTLLKRLGSTGTEDARELAAMQREEKTQLQSFAVPASPADDSNVTLF